MQNEYYEMSLDQLLTPRSFSELNLPQKTIKRLEIMKRTQYVRNLIFYGKPGTGKTSAAKLLIEGLDVYEIYPTSRLNELTFKDIDEIALGGGLDFGPKVLFLDEADNFTAKELNKLKTVIDRTQKVHFIMTTNHINHFSEALKSRIEPICFDVSVSERAEVVEQMIERYSTRLAELRIQFDREKLVKIVKLYFPDLRRIAKRLEAEFVQFD